MTTDEIRALLPVWQQRLGLAHWTVQVRVADLDHEDAILEIERHENAHRAVISVAEWLDRGERPDWLIETVDARFIEKILVHELCHLLFRDVMFTVRDDLPEFMGQIAHELLMRQLNRHEEATVDLLSGALVDAWPREGSRA